MTTMTIKNFRHRAEMGQLWYDELRGTFGQNASKSTLREVAIYDLTTRLAGDVRDIKDKMADVEQMPSTDWLDRKNAQLPAPITLQGSQVETMTDAARRARQENITPEILGEYARYAQCACVFDILQNSSPAELLVSDRKLIEQILASKRGNFDAVDLTYSPFPRCWWEFSRPVQIATVQVYGAFFGSYPELKTAIGGLVTKVRDFYSAFTWGQTWGISTGCADLPFRVEDEAIFQGALGRLWDFVTCRNISYERIRRRSGVKKHTEARYRHNQGQNNTAVREVIILDMDRSIQIKDNTDNSPGTQHQWAFRSLIPGAFHRWVYCETCGDVHRHDLLGQACRKCGEIVGPRANLRIEKYWHAPYYRGPVEAPVRDTVREII